MLQEPLVQFVIIGAQKCGTTSMAEQLSMHPSVRLCAQKEPHFFSKNYKTKAFAEYHGLFPNPVESGCIYGEASTSYSFMDEYPETAERLYRYNPHLRLIYMLRDPVARAESHFNHRLRNGALNHADPFRALEENEQFIQRSQYARQLKHYLRFFNRQQISIIVFEDYVRNPRPVVEKTLKFIGVDPDTLGELDTRPKNISDARQRLKYIPMANIALGFLESIPGTWRLSKWIPLKTLFPQVLKHRLWRALEPDALELEHIFNLDLTQWKNKYKNT